ncbi:hypothetical protein [Luteolibacter luteus]|uniref:LysM domain-containing protein n=1 Tax=Luteolibacter luteus TaxID=2728835 RepID=A0A858RN03_9BACT|nr:hypothetical protein [Luteolibacter luteus]QJE98387.1 hypothetical protein HHL09_22230 [Luteolibacter luteus]
MKPWSLPILASLALCSCDRQARSTKSANPASTPAPLPVVTDAEIPAPASPAVTVEPGMALGTIATKAYGHAKFSGFLARLNGLPDPQKIPAGAVLKTPSLPIAFHQAGLDPRYQPAINALAKSCTDFQAALPHYLEVRRASGLNRGSFKIPKKAKDSFLICADAIEAAKRELETAKEPHQVPRATLDQFAQASSELRELASGSVDGYGYDSDLVGQHLGLGFTNAIIWVQEGYR